MISRISAAVDIRRSIESVYKQVTQFESFPLFIGDVVEVQQLDDTHLFWRANIGAAARGYYVTITEQRLDELLAWRSDDGGPAHWGSVTVHRVNDGTRVTVQLSIDPSGIAEPATDKLRVLERLLQGGLDGFKQFVENEGAQTC